MLEELQPLIEELKKRKQDLLLIFKYKDKKKRLMELQKMTEDNEFWQDPEKNKGLLKELTHLRREIEAIDTFVNDVEHLVELYQMALDEDSQELEPEIREEYERLLKELERLEIKTTFTDKNDKNNAIMTIHPGAGGTESCDWASMLLRMYQRYLEKKGFDVQITDIQPGDEAGIKSATLLIKGDYAYGYLKGESGIHRLVRISPFDSNKRRHTSFASVDVIPEIEDDIEINIDPNDLRIDTYRSSGAGGQHVNVTESAVRITHLPTGIVVQCQNERSQHQNKATAMKILMSRLYEYYRRKREEEESKREKKEIGWGNQIRSYVLHPYKMVKDLRTGVEMGDAERVLDGDLDMFIEAYLKTMKH